LHVFPPWHMPHLLRAELMQVYTTSQGLGNFTPLLWGFLHRH
jgi:hypothetical protein